MDKDMCISLMEEQMKKVMAHLQGQLLTIRAGKASTSMLSGVKIDYYGALSPLEQVASLSTPDARTIAVQPWEKNLLPVIEKAIMSANLGFNPQNNGEIIRVPIPPLTEERRKELVKQVKGEGENAKAALRNARREANDTLKKLQKEGLAEDVVKVAMDRVQKITDSFNERVDGETAAKEKEIMTV
ncbi:MAG: ribosome recycling factor [Bacteroidia bacterium]|jgi:ribosome recycling factor|nr:ribosome recycling factor [Bacteroidia bacterium]